MWGLFLCILDWVGASPLPPLANILNTNEPALKVLLSLIMSYAIAAVYNKYVRTYSSSNKIYRNVYFIITGLDIAWFNFSSTLCYNAVPVIIMYLVHKVLGPGKISCILSCVLNMAYLVAGYIYTESENYDITWTMPHCVLTLKLIALSFDLWDGKKLNENQELSANQMKTAISKIPTIVEMFGFVYFPACFLVGPMFSFKRYSEFIYDSYPLDDKKSTEMRIKSSLNKFGTAMLYLLIHQVGGIYFNMEYMLTENFAESSIFYRHIYCGVWGHITLFKYISCWLLTEGACILFGLSYNGMDKDKTRWDGCNNIKLTRFLTATKFQHYIDSFNCNTNYFAAEYIYKRLKFLGDRNISQGATLLFLALWHGVNSGYYATFFNEFVIIYMERELEHILKRTIFYDIMWANPISKFILYIILKAYTVIFMGWSLAPFDLKVYSKWIYVYSSLWFSGLALFVPWSFLYKPLLKNIIKKYDLAKKNDL